MILLKLHLLNQSVVCVIRSLLVYVCHAIWKLGQLPNGATPTSKDLITHATTLQD